VTRTAALLALQLDLATGVTQRLGSDRGIHAVSSGVFGTIQSDVSCLQYTFGRVAVLGRHGNTDRNRHGTERDSSVVQGQTCHAFPELLGLAQRTGKVRLRHEHEQLFTTHAAYHVSLPGVRSERCANFFQHVVASVMAEGVVERLEVVDVDCEHPELSFFADGSV